MNKTTYGFVTQRYDGNKCVEQEFIASDQVDYDEDDLLTPCEGGNEEYFPFNMEQPETAREKRVREALYSYLRANLSDINEAAAEIYDLGEVTTDELNILFGITDAQYFGEEE